MTDQQEIKETPTADGDGDNTADFQMPSKEEVIQMQQELQ